MPGVSAAQQEQVLQYVPLARFLARRLERKFPLLAQDLRQEAFLALVEAIQRYDPGSGAPVEKWVTYRIKGAQADYLRERDELTQTEREHLAEIRGWEMEAEQRIGRAPTQLEVARVILAATILPSWILKEVQRARSKRWRQLEEKLRQATGKAPGDECIAAAFGKSSKDAFLKDRATEAEIAAVVDATHEIGTRETLSTEDLPGFEPTSPQTVATETRVREDLLRVDNCFRQLPLSEQVILRMVVAGIPMKIGQRVLNVSQANAYRMVTNGMSHLATRLAGANNTRGKQDGWK